MTATLKVGDPVHVAFDGVITNVDHTTEPYHVEYPVTGDGTWFAADVATKIASPEPAWKVGDAIILTAREDVPYTCVFDGYQWIDHEQDKWTRQYITDAWNEERIIRLVPEVRA